MAMFMVLYFLISLELSILQAKFNARFASTFEEVKKSPNFNCQLKSFQRNSQGSTAGTEETVPENAMKTKQSYNFFFLNPLYFNRGAKKTSFSLFCFTQSFMCKIHCVKLYGRKEMEKSLPHFLKRFFSYWAAWKDFVSPVCFHAVF